MYFVDPKIVSRPKWIRSNVDLIHLGGEPIQGSAKYIYQILEIKLLDNRFSTKI